MERYLRSTYYLDYEEEPVKEFADKHASSKKGKKENAIRLYYAVRDGFRYNPFVLDLRPEGLKASSLLRKKSGYCIEKAILLASCARYVGVPSRLSFYIVQNHIATGRIEKVLKTNKLVFHGATEFFLDERWLKVTPAFDARLCKHLDVATLEFDGTKDSIFQQFDKKGNVFMKYLHDYGDFDDMPYDLAIAEFIKHYPHIFKNDEYSDGRHVYDLSV